MQKHKTFLLLGIGFAMIVGSAALSFVIDTSKKDGFSVAKSLSVCAQDTGKTLVECSRAVIKSLLTAHTTHELLTSIATGTLPAVFQGCHGVGHIIGDETFKKTNSVETALSECTSECYNACIHGVISAAVIRDLGEKYSDEDIAHANAAEIESLGTKYCAGQPGLCHAMGHLLYINLNDLLKALTGCDAIAKDYRAEACHKGVFMQAEGGVGYSLVVGDAAPPPAAQAPTDDYAYPCDTLAVKYQHSCFQYVWNYEGDLVLKNHVNTATERLAILVDTCSKFSGKTRSYCFEGIGKLMGLRATYVPDVSADGRQMCTTFSQAEDRRSCLLGKILIETQFGAPINASTMCAGVDSGELGFCYNVLFQFMGPAAIFDDPSSRTGVCAGSKDGDACATYLKAYQGVRDTLPNYLFGLYGKINK